MTTSSLYEASREQEVDVVPASFAQQRLWFLDQVVPMRAAYNISAALHMRGQLEEVAFERSLHAIVERHEVLRTTFEVCDGRLTQVIRPRLDVPLQVRDLEGLAGPGQEAEVLRLATEQATAPFDLAHGPLLRMLLLRLSSQEHVLLFTIHHIVFDGWSMGVFLQELQALYQATALGSPSPLPELAVQYADFALWQQEWLQGEVLEGELAYWKQKLAGAPTVLELPADRPRPVLPTYRGSMQRFALSQHLSDQLEGLSRKEGASLFMTLLAAMSCLLSRYSGQEDIVIGSPIAGRSRPETEELIGCFVNTQVLRSDLSGDPSFRDLLARVREVALEAQAHQELPFDVLVKELQPQRELGHTPFFQVMMSLDYAPASASSLEWTLIQEEAATGTAKFDLSLLLTHGPEGLCGYFEYSSDLFEQATIARMAGHFATLLQAVVADPGLRLSQLPLLTEGERQQLLVAWNATAAPYPAERCVHQLFEEQAERRPEAVALLYEGQELTYRQLNERANQLAHHLRRLGVGPEVLVGLCMERSIEMVVGLLGILKAGGAYVPLDPAFPAERISFMLADAQAPVLLTQRAQQHLTARLADRSTSIVYLDGDAAELAELPGSNAGASVASDHLAYVIYTSGSTGRPKGVQIPHRAVVNFLLSMRRQPGLGPEDTWLAVTTLSFDIAALELLLPLVVGARVIVASSAVATNGTALEQALSRSGTTVMQATPVTWQLLLAAGWQGEPALKVLCGGEALPPELARQLLPRAAELWNLYGPTETTIWSTTCRVEPGFDEVTIGRPIANTHIYILDAHLNPVPIGVPGELYIGGDGLARGYLKRPELTAERFIPHPFSAEPGARLYKTGDLARYLADGSIEHLGRLDFQVKIRGFRIELGEIEAVLARHDAVRQAVVLAREDVPGDKRLVAYVVSRVPVTAEELRQHVTQHVPLYMVPSSFVFLQTLPLTPNNKVDRRRLPAPERGGADEGAFVAPGTQLQKTIASVWSQVLGIERVGIHDTFFALGGHSLLAVQVLSRLRAALGVEVPLHRFLEAPTVAQLAQLFAQQQAGSGPNKPAFRAQPRQAYRVSADAMGAFLQTPRNE